MPIAESARLQLDLQKYFANELEVIAQIFSMIDEFTNENSVTLIFSYSESERLIKLGGILMLYGSHIVIRLSSQLSTQQKLEALRTLLSKTHLGQSELQKKDTYYFA